MSHHFCFGYYYASILQTHTVSTWKDKTIFNQTSPPQKKTGIFAFGPFVQKSNFFKILNCIHEDVIPILRTSNHIFSRYVHKYLKFKKSLVRVKKITTYKARKIGLDLRQNGILSKPESYHLHRSINNIKQGQIDDLHHKLKT